MEDLWRKQKCCYAVSPLEKWVVSVYGRDYDGVIIRMIKRPNTVLYTYMLLQSPHRTKNVENSHE